MHERPVVRFTSVREGGLSTTSRLCAAILVAVFALSPSGASAGDAPAKPPLFDAHAKIAARAAHDLGVLLASARKRGLGTLADELARKVLHFNEDDEAARRWLGYKRVDNVWDAPDDPVTHKTTRAKGEASVRRRWARKAKALAHSLWSLLEAAPKSLEVEARRFVYEDISALTPADERLLRLRTHELKDGEWLTLEARRSSELWQAEQAYKDGIVESTPEAIDIELHPLLVSVPNLNFRSHVQVGDVKVWGTCPRGEAVAIASRAHLTAKMFAHVFGRKYEVPENLGFVIVTTRKERGLLASGLRLRYLRPNEPAYEIAGTNLIMSGRTQGWRVRQDTALRFLLYRLFEDAFGCGLSCEWAAQGVSVLLTYSAASTYYTIMGWDASTATALDYRLQMELFKPDVNWGKEALPLWNAGRLPTLAALAPQSRREIWVTDLVACYVYAYFFMFAHRDKAAHFYRRLGAGETPAQAIQAEFGWDLKTFQQHVDRWMNDFRAYVEGVSHRIRATRKPPR